MNVNEICKQCVRGYLLVGSDSVISERQGSILPSVPINSIGLQGYRVQRAEPVNIFACILSLIILAHLSSSLPVYRIWY